MTALPLPSPVAPVVGALLATPGLTGREIYHAAQIISAVAAGWSDGRLARSWIAAGDFLERIALAFEPQSPSPPVAEHRRRQGATLIPQLIRPAEPEFAVLRNMPAPYARARTLEGARAAALVGGERDPDSFLTVLQVLETHHISTWWPDPDVENLA